MGKFRFKLQAVLDLKESKLKEALRYMGLAQGRLELELNKKNFIRSRLDSSLQERENLSHFGGGERAVIETFVEGSKKRLEQADQAIFRATKILDKTREQVMACKNACKVFEKLKEKALDEHKKSIAKKAAKVSEEWVTLRYKRDEERQSS